MRMTCVIALALLSAGCTTTPTTKIPAPAAARDGKTPLAPEMTGLSQRTVGQRMRDAEVASGKLDVQGQLVR